MEALGATLAAVEAAIARDEAETLPSLWDKASGFDLDTFLAKSAASGALGCTQWALDRGTAVDLRALRAAVEGRRCFPLLYVRAQGLLAEERTTRVLMAAAERTDQPWVSRFLKAQIAPRSP